MVAKNHNIIPRLYPWNPYPKVLTSFLLVHMTISISYEPYLKIPSFFQIRDYITQVDFVRKYLINLWFRFKKHLAGRSNKIRKKLLRRCGIIDTTYKNRILNRACDENMFPDFIVRFYRIVNVKYYLRPSLFETCPGFWKNEFATCLNAYLDTAYRINWTAIPW
jgi:hypothetical protein